MSRDVKKISTHKYPRIKPATGRKWISAGNGYGYFLYPHINGAGTNGNRTRGYSYPLYSNLN